MVLFKAKLNDFDYEKNIWVVPLANHKTGRRTKKAIIRPVIPAAKELIEQAKKLDHGNEHLIVKYYVNNAHVAGQSFSMKSSDSGQ
ncbi:hypothetical protein M5U04_07530 [Xenorhabdus sp. XENO-1]|uniref:hypothetical protein n=1 Tax=Xenorhabdus bovienii TaxID=40576 RepID=UPI0020CA54AA|nr:hypothetical protein [Xenorhabdus bovienii]MCP9267949.1 hypothetical protein [Xenorhabdus bovienii subsp. africana]